MLTNEQVYFYTITRRVAEEEQVINLSAASHSAFIKLSHIAFRRTVAQSGDTYTILNDSVSRPVTTNLRFNIQYFMDQNKSRVIYERLSSMLSDLGICLEGNRQSLVSELISHIDTNIRPWVTEGRRIMPLMIIIRTCFTSFVPVDSEEYRELVRSRLNSEAPNNYGMVPTARSAFRLLKLVKMEKDENCSICVEDINIGEIGVRMPCNHYFHFLCIRKWLKISHYCPNCRFEMPTQQSLSN